MASRDMFGFDEMPASAVPDDILAADDRTLRLSAPAVSLETIQQFIRYQRALLERLSARPLKPELRNEHFATAHQEALSVSGLDVRTHAKISAVATQFASSRVTVSKLREKQKQLRKKMAEVESQGEDPTEADRELDQKLTNEIVRLDPFSTLERRYGAEVIQSLRPFEEELVALHTALLPLLTS